MYFDAACVPEVSDVTEIYTSLFTINGKQKENKEKKEK